MDNNPRAKALCLGYNIGNHRQLPFELGRFFMKTYQAIIEKCCETGLYIGYIPGFPGAHSQGQTLDELNRNLCEVVRMLLEDGEPEIKAEFVGVHNVVVS